MRVTIAARHCEIPDVVRTRTEEQMAKLRKYEPGISAAEVTFEVEKHVKKVETILSVDREEPVVAGGEGTEFREALDLVAERLGKILRRRRSLKKDHKGPSPAKTLPLDE